jgi:hypothetical protein
MVEEIKVKNEACYELRRQIIDLSSNINDYLNEIKVLKQYARIDTIKM